jgi:hypothetical protein
VTGGNLLLEDGVGTVGLLAQHLEGALIAQHANNLATTGRLNDRDLRFRLGQKISSFGHPFTSRVRFVPGDLCHDRVAR